MAMTVEMVCSCECMIELSHDADDNTPVWYMVYRFADAHVKCGYMTKTTHDHDSADAVEASS